MIVVLVLVFAVLYALALLTPVSNLLQVPSLYDLLGIGDAVPWSLLVLGVVLPLALFAVAMLLGRGRPLFDRALILAVGLGAAHAGGLSIIAWALALQPPVALG